MATSQVAICNLALDAIGTRSTISSMSEGSAEAAACARQYEPALEAVLQAAHWNFARKQATMTLLKDGTATPSQNCPPPWAYEYAYPSDCLACRYVMPLATSQVSTFVGTPAVQYPITPPVRFIVSSDEDSNGNPINVILTNQVQAVLCYTFRCTNVNLFDAQFVRAFANYLGYLLAIPLSGDKALAKMAFQIADQTCKQAQASNGNEGITINDHVPDWITTRGYVMDWGHAQDGQWIFPPQSLAFVS